jgi:hypothetical protein
MTKFKPKPIHQTYERVKNVRDHLLTLHGQCINVVEQRDGILIELWALGKSTVILWANPHGWDVYAPVHHSNDSAATLAAISKFAIDRSYETPDGMKS